MAAGKAGDGRWLSAPSRYHSVQALAGAIALSLAFGAHGALAAAPSAAIQQRVEALAPAAAADPAEAALVSFYRQRRYAPAWSNESRRRSLAAAIAGLGLDGLVPGDYAFGDPPRSDRDEQLADFDVRATRACLEALWDLKRGRVDPNKLYRNWSIAPLVFRPDDAARALNVAVAGGDVETLFQAHRPQHPVYGGLRGAMRMLLSVREVGDWTIAPGPGLRRGDRGARVATLRRRLEALQYLKPAQGKDDDHFDAVVESAIRSYQSDHYLEPDGRVGPQTRGALNVPIARRIAQLRVNLERARWLLPKAQGEYVLVDIAGYRLRYYRDSQVVWSARVQVGRSARRTPALESAITRVVFNPTWTIPPTIFRQDVLPRVKEDVGYLAQNHIRVFDRSGAELAPRDVNWDAPEGVYLRQDAGPGNSLGAIAFYFDNPYGIRIHDTPRQDLFAPPRRPFSSGCIRVERAAELAALLLGDPREWTPGAIERTIAAGDTREAILSRPVPVLVLYWTVALRQGGGVAFKPDIYGLDHALLAELDRRPQPVPST